MMDKPIIPSSREPEQKRVHERDNSREPDLKRYCGDDHGHHHYSHPPPPGKDASKEEMIEHLLEVKETMRMKLNRRYNEKQELYGRLDDVRDELRAERERTKSLETENKSLIYEYERMRGDYRAIEDKLAAARNEINGLLRTLANRDTEIHNMRQAMHNNNPQALYHAQMRIKELEIDLAKTQATVSRFAWDPVALQNMQRKIVGAQFDQIKRERDEAVRHVDMLTAEVAQLRDHHTRTESELRRSRDELRNSIAKMQASGGVFTDGNAVSGAQFKVQNLETELEETRKRLASAELRARELENTKRQLEIVDAKARSLEERVHTLESALRNMGRECQRLRDGK